MFTVYNAHTGRKVSRHRLEERARKAADDYRQKAVVVSDEEDAIIRAQETSPEDRSRADWIVPMTEIERIAALP